MRTVFLILVFVHGLIHLLGFAKGTGIKEIRELTLPISRPMGYLWLAAAILVLAYGILHLLNNKYSWLIGLAAVALSQLLIMAFWKDARFGTVPNALIVLVSMVSLGYYNFNNRVEKETGRLLSENRVTGHRLLSEKDLTGLPEPVKRWLRHSGAVGKPFIDFGRVTQTAEMQMKPEQNDWMTATAIQYTGIDKPAFIWTVFARMNGLLYFQGRDKFEDGQGEMLIKMNSLISVVNERGPKLDEGTLQRYLGEMVWFPSLALSPWIRWEEINDTTAKATMSYKGTSGSGTFYYNNLGDVTKYSALRYKGNDAKAKRYGWEMNISDYGTFEGIWVPVKMTSTWKLENGNWTWLKLKVTNIEYNDSPKN